MRINNQTIICDVCKKVIPRNDRVTIVIQKTVKADNYYTKDVNLDNRVHFCFRCYERLRMIVPEVVNDGRKINAKVN